MNNTWQEYNLGDAINMISEKVDIKEVNIDEFISTENLLPNLGGIEKSSGLPKSGKVTAFKKGDVLFSNIRTYFRKVWYASFDGACSNDVIVFRGTEVENGFLYYLLADNSFIDYTTKTAKGTKMPRGDKNAIKKYIVNLPPLPEQKAIAHILGTLDDKIELNRKMNETLEQMAQALFKSWFVDFDPVFDNAITKGNTLPESLKHKVEQRKKVITSGEYNALPKEIMELFPASFVFNDEFEKWIPEGWEVSSISDLAYVVGGGTPSTKVEDYYCDNGIPWLSPKDLSGYDWRYISRGAKDITDLGLKKSSAKLMPKGTVLFSSRAPIGYVAIAENKVCTNQGFKSLVPKSGVPSEFLYQFLKANINAIEAIASGSTFKEVSGTAIKEFTILNPQKEVLGKYEMITKEWNNRFIQLQKQTDSLVKQREVLLPQLMSGKFRIGEEMMEKMTKVASEKMAEI